MSTENFEDVHPAEELLRSFVDGTTQGSEVVEHLKGCGACRARVKALRGFDAALRSALTERAPANTAAQVLRRLGVRERESFAFRTVKWLAPALAFGGVSTLMYFAFRTAGIFNSPDARGSASGFEGALEAASKTATSFGANFSNWLSGYGSFAFAHSTFGVTSFLVLFLAGVALLDRYVFLPMFRNRRVG